MRRLGRGGVGAGRVARGGRHGRRQPGAGLAAAGTLSVAAAGGRAPGQTQRLPARPAALHRPAAAPAALLPRPGTPRRHRGGTNPI